MGLQVGHRLAADDVPEGDRAIIAGRGDEKLARVEGQGVDGDTAAGKDSRLSDGGEVFDLDRAVEPGNGLCEPPGWMATARTGPRRAACQGCPERPGIPELYGLIAPARQRHPSVAGRRKYRRC